MLGPSIHIDMIQISAFKKRLSNNNSLGRASNNNLRLPSPEHNSFMHVDCGCFGNIPIALQKLLNC